MDARQIRADVAMADRGHADDDATFRHRLLRYRPAVGIIVAALVVGLGGGVAYAAWSASGTGTGSANTSTYQPVTVSAFVGGDAANSALIPGGSADVILRVTNPNAYPVKVYSVSGNGSITADAAHSGCITTGVTFTAPSAPISPAVTAPANSTLLVHLAGAASMSTASQSACQGATFHIPVTLAVRT